MQNESQLAQAICDEAYGKLKDKQRKKKKRSFKRRGNAYEKRAENLKQLGFNSYAEYLRSDLWRLIRSKVFSRSKNKCEVCGSNAAQVHHRSYCIEVLVGKRLDLLTAICNSCHRSCEFKSDGTKRHYLSKVNSVISKMCKKNGRQLVWKCAECKRNTPKLGHKLCGKCEREKYGPPERIDEVTARYIELVKSF